MAEKKIVVIADEYTAIPFKMIGIEAYPVKSGEEARKLLEQLIEREDVGVVLVASDYRSAVEDIMEKVARERSDMIVTTLPTLKNPGKPVDMRRLLLQALGFGG